MLPLDQQRLTPSAWRAACPQVRTASCGGTACVNSFGDEQLAVDLLADKLLFEALKYSGCCKLACSEEVPEPLDLGGEPAACGRRCCFPARCPPCHARVVVSRRRRG